MAHGTGSSTPEASSTVATESQAHEKQTAQLSTASQPKRKRTLLVAIAAIAIVVLGLALGLGLGLGLRNRKSHSGYVPPTTGAVSSWTNGSSLPFVQLEDLVDPSQFILSPKFDINAAPQTREYNWTLSEVIAAPGGITRRMLVVNGKFPGETIEANLGDRIIVHVNNQLSNTTAMHWHGQYQNGTNYMDGTYSVTECGIAPNSSFTYNWTVQNTGTYWWHAHAAAQSSDGLIGALILHSPNDTYGFRSSPSDTSRPANTSYDGDLIMVVQDMYNLFSTDWLSLYLNLQLGSGEGDEPVPDYGTINGVGIGNCGGVPDGQACVRNGNKGIYSNFTVEPNQRYRIRVINAGSLAGFGFSVDNHPLSVIEADGTSVHATPAQSFMVEVAQRTSVIIETNQTAGAYWIRSTMSEDMLAYDNPTLVKDQRAVLRYAGIAADVMPSNADQAPTLADLPMDLNTTALVPAMVMNAPKPTKQTIMYINFGKAPSGDYHAYFNNTAFGAPYAGYSTFTNVQNSTIASAATNYDGAFVVNVDDYEVMDIIVNNQDDGAHPMHMHGYSPFILANGAGNYVEGKSINLNTTFANPMRRDTFVIPGYSWAVVRIIADNPGVWVFHCHLSSHMAAGLMMQFTIQPSKIAQQQVPADYKQQCANIKAMGAGVAA
ncbi:hypothetical protein OC861_001696 [Tilletia horrida]|nr:hypothetical protein OC861_001696 [Tilletia horrida]